MVGEIANCSFNLSVEVNQEFVHMHVVKNLRFIFSFTAAAAY